MTVLLFVALAKFQESINERLSRNLKDSKPRPINQSIPYLLLINYVDIMSQALC